jgi:16S rRNA (cytidine1402-2'-O)-methyltransferase
VLSPGDTQPREGVDPAAVDAVRRLVEAGARPRVAAGVVSELTGAPANALYRDAVQAR